MPRSTDPRDLGERPDGPISGLLWDHSRRMNAGRNHAFVEGYPPADMAVLIGYDRTFHPWIHGRRPSDLTDRCRAFTDRLRGRFAE